MSMRGFSRVSGGLQVNELWQLYKMVWFPLAAHTPVPPSAVCYQAWQPWAPHCVPGLPLLPRASWVFYASVSADLPALACCSRICLGCWCLHNKQGRAFTWACEPWFQAFLDPRTISPIFSPREEYGCPGKGSSWVEHIWELLIQIKLNRFLCSQRPNVHMESFKGVWREYSAFPEVAVWSLLLVPALRPGFLTSPAPKCLPGPWSLSCPEVSLLLHDFRLLFFLF